MTNNNDMVQDIDEGKLIERELQQAFKQERLPEKDFSHLFTAKFRPAGPGFIWLRQWQMLKKAKISLLLIFCSGFGLSQLLAMQQSSTQFVLPMQDAVSAYQLYQAFSRPANAEETEQTLAWFEKITTSQLQLPDWRTKGFQLRGAQPVVSPYGAAVLLAYHQDGKPPLLLFVRQDNGNRKKTLQWRQAGQLHLGYFYRNQIALAISYTDKAMVRDLSQTFYKTMSL